MPTCPWIALLWPCSRYMQRLTPASHSTAEALAYLYNVIRDDLSAVTRQRASTLHSTRFIMWNKTETKNGTKQKHQTNKLKCLRTGPVRCASLRCAV